MNIIGLGKAGCQVAKKFENYGQYKVFCIDTNNKGYSTFLPVRVENSHEDYEKNYKKLTLDGCRGRTTLVLSAGKISGCVLRVLEQLRDQPLEIIYIKPDESAMTEATESRSRIVLGVLQEYVRSNKLEKIYIISNKKVESIAQNISIKNYWDEINNIISSTYHMLNVFKNTEPLLTNSLDSKETVRIGTFGVINFETGKERLFYDLQFPRLRKYFYGINSDTLDSDKEILHKIRSFVDLGKEEKIDVGFSIYSTDYDDNYVYSIHLASYVQEQNIE
jgi:hypothetical protein